VPGSGETVTGFEPASARSAAGINALADAGEEPVPPQAHTPPHIVRPTSGTHARIIIDRRAIERGLSFASPI
jgi:hypothetical protein